MESALINWLRQRVPTNSQLVLGIGDDAAILQLTDGGDCVVTSDTLTDTVDFELCQCDPRRVGRKSLAVNLSDLAAMAARPIAATVALVVPRTSSADLVRDLYEGMFPLAEQFQIAIAGGDTNSWDGPLVLSITALGEVTEHGIWKRSGAQPGDAILVTGCFGGSLLGRHFDFQPRVGEALQLNAGYSVHAAIDVSDGLSLDLARLCEASQCGSLLELDCVPISPDAHRLAERRGDKSALEHALSDGEDFELILAVPLDDARRLLREQPLDVPLTRIGQFIEQPGLWHAAGGGRRERLEPSGYQHRLDT
jgi:thiamine-monophosphate kinase